VAPMFASGGNIGEAIFVSQVFVEHPAEQPFA
jgi:hypothetical protein